MGRKFCVEMQMEWSNAFKQRVLFNASKIYVAQAMRSDEYGKLKPVYSLNLVNDIFERDMPDCFIHNYRIVHEKDTDKVIEGLHFTFVELPKFEPRSISERRMAVLWLRFLTEIDASIREAPAELLNDPEISKALEEVNVSAFSEEELRAYDKFWDNVRVEKTLLHDSFQNGMAKGERQKAMEIAKSLLDAGMTVEQTAQITGLAVDEVLTIRK